MLKGLYISAASALNHAERHDIVANNLANVNTPGFKPQRPQFREVFFHTMAANQPAGYVAGAAGAAFVEANSVFTPGPVEYTKRPEDFAVTSEGLFAVEREGEVLYTRAGNFQIGPDGYLTTADGRGRVLLENGIPILVGNAELEVDRAGIATLRQQDGSRQQLGLMWVLRPQDGDYTLLKRRGDNLFSAPLSRMTRVDEARVEQGALEQSAVSAVKEMIDVISAMRAYEASIQFVRIMDTTLGQAAELARPMTA